VGRRAWHRVVTFQIVCFAWIFFRSDSFADAWSLIERLFTAWGEPSPLVSGGVLAAIAVGVGSQYLPRRFPLVLMARFSRLPIPAQAAVLSLVLLVTHTMGPEGVAPFIYFQF
jgi:D-alanyl-lipoteichoic acid acyltransferase DltB (MBOAT superfamily)